jgi:hypothetical protein
MMIRLMRTTAIHFTRRFSTVARHLLAPHQLSAPNGIGGLKLSLEPHQHAAAHSSADAAAHAVAARAADPHPSAALAAAACPSTTTTFAMGAVAAASSVTASLVVSSRGPLRAPVMAPRASSCTWCGCPARRRLAHVLL